MNNRNLRVKDVYHWLLLRRYGMCEHATYFTIRGLTIIPKENEKWYVE